MFCYIFIPFCSRINTLIVPYTISLSLQQSYDLNHFRPIYM